MSVKHFVTWEVSIDELEDIIKKLKETPLMSIPLDETTELLIRLSTIQTVTTITTTANTDTQYFHIPYSIGE